MTSRLLAGLSARTKVVAMTWVHSSTGVRTPGPGDRPALRALEQAAGQRVLLCVDGVHGFAAVDVDLPDLGCDFLSAGTHKWLFGPRGTGIVWGRNFGPLTELIPSFSGPGTAPACRPAATTPSSTGGRSTRPSPSTSASAAPLSSSAPSTRRRSSRRAWPPSAPTGSASSRPSTPTVSAGHRLPRRRGLPPGNGVLALREQGIVASVTPYATSYLRLGPSLVTSPEQVDAAVEAIATLA